VRCGASERHGSDSDFAAAFAGGKNLAGIQAARGIESVADGAHEREIGFGEKQRHEAIFFHADAVFASDCAAHFDTEANDGVRGGDSTMELFFVAGVEKNDGMQVAVASVENVADLETVFFADAFDFAEGLRQFSARNHAVLNVVSGREASDGAEGVFAALPEKVALLGVAGDADFTRAVEFANFGDLRGVLFGGFAEAVDFDEEDGGAVERESGVNPSFDGAERPAIEHFAGRGSDAARGDFDDGFGGSVNAIVDGEEGFDGFWRVREADGDFGDESERAFGADEKAAKVVAGRVERFAANANELCVGQNKLQAENVVRRDAVSESVRAAGVFGDVAADGAGSLAGGIGREVESGVGDGGGQIGIDDAGLDDGALIFDVEFDNAIHAREGNDDAAVARERAAGESRASPASDDGNVMAIGDFDDANDVGSVAGKDDAIGARDFDGAVVFVEQQVFRAAEDVFAGEKMLEVGDEALIHGRLDVRE